MNLLQPYQIEPDTSGDMELINSDSSFGDNVELF